jgi:hypothetical protein
MPVKLEAGCQVRVPDEVSNLIRISPACCWELENKHPRPGE